MIKNNKKGCVYMLSRSHIASGMTSGLIVMAMSIVPLNLYEFIPAIILGSVAPDLDTAKSWASQAVPFIDDKLREMHILKHRGLTHGLSGVVAMIILYILVHNPFTLGFCIGYITHCITDKILSITHIKITPKSDKMLYQSFWVLNTIIIGFLIFN